MHSHRPPEPRHTTSAPTTSAPTTSAPTAPFTGNLPGEDGYELWLRYRTVDDSQLRKRYQAALSHLVCEGDGRCERSAADELSRGLSGLLGTRVTAHRAVTSTTALVVGTRAGSPLIRTLVPAGDLDPLGDEGYLIRRLTRRGRSYTVVAAPAERGVLYGAFHLLRLLQTHSPLDHLDITESPAAPLRLVNHWDNADRTIERGYAGRSFFAWDELPQLDDRYRDYARTLASLGLNGAVLNNVNADADFLSDAFLDRLAPLAAVLRRYGVRLYLSADFAAPMELDGLDTADPQDGRVQDWWRRKAAHLYDAIPDFGGFLVKANSEGRPGPLDYGRTHADGANLLAKAVQPHGGIVMWRAFVHDSDEEWDRQAYRQFVPLDGSFADNAIVQIKNGPIDFQVREPAHPLFGALPHTNSMIELQVTQEYTGHATHLCYLVPQWKECLDFDTHREGAGSTVAHIVSGRTHPYTHCHGYGRLCWNPELSAEELATEWTRMTFGNDPQVLRTVPRLLLNSWRTYEDYTAPLGVGYLTYPPDASVPGHFDPSPTRTTQFHHSGRTGIGYDRTAATGNGYTRLYAEPARSRYESLAQCPEELLLFLHHVPYTHRLHDGRTVIQHIYDTHFAGADRVRTMREDWDALRGRIDQQRLGHVHRQFGEQLASAAEWRDTLVAYWFSHSRIRDEGRSWIQAALDPSDSVLFGGRRNRLPVQIANATPSGLRSVTTVEAPAGWLTEPATRFVASRGLETAQVTVTPPDTPTLAPIRVRPASGTVHALNSSLLAAADTVVTPPASRCVHALDVGDPDAPLLEGYRRLAPDTAWHQGAGFGWVGHQPEASDHQQPDPLRRDFVSDTTPAVLRLTLPAGRCTAHLLTGDADTLATPTVVRVDGTEKARSDRLAGGRFQWLRVPLDGGSGGGHVELQLSGVHEESWHLSACVVTAD